MRQTLVQTGLLVLAVGFLVPNIVQTQSNTLAQTQTPSAGGVGADAAIQEAAQKEAIAEQLIAYREAVSGRRFDAAARQALKNKLTEQSVSELEAMNVSGSLRPAAVGAPLAGDTGGYLVFVPITPCRVADTRFGTGSFGKFTGGGQQRSYIVAGAIPAAQGGGNADCNVPFSIGGASAVALNITVANFDGLGDFRITPYPAAMPNSSVINFNLNQGFAIANGITAAICDPAVSGCGSDLTVMNDGAGADLILDVMGYYRAYNDIAFQSTTFSFAPVINTALSPATAATLATLTFTPKFSGTARVQARAYCNITDAGSATNLVTFIGATAADTPGFFNDGVIGPTFTPGFLHQLGFTAERFVSVTRNVITTLKLFGYHENIGAGSATNCSGTMVVNGLF